MFTSVDFVAADQAQELSKTLEARYEDLLAVVADAGNIDLQEWAMRAELAEAKARVLRTEDPKTLGKNEAQRTAAIDALVKCQRDNLWEVELKKTEIRPRVEIARLRVEQARAQLRLLEVATSFHRDR